MHRYKWKFKTATEKNGAKQNSGENIPVSNRNEANLPSIFIFLVAIHRCSCVSFTCHCCSRCALCAARNEKDTRHIDSKRSGWLHLSVVIALRSKVQLWHHYCFHSQEGASSEWAPRRPLSHLKTGEKNLPSSEVVREKKRNISTGHMSIVVGAVDVFAAFVQTQSDALFDSFYSYDAHTQIGCRRRSSPTRFKGKLQSMDSIGSEWRWMWIEGAKKGKYFLWWWRREAGIKAAINAEHWTGNHKYP